MKKEYGLALGSGGIRGMAHIALIEYLENKYEMHPVVITGCSAGSLIGGLYALEPDINSVYKKLSYSLKNFDTEIKSMKKSLDSKISGFTKLLSSMGIMKNEVLFRMLKPLFYKKKFSDCKIPFGVVALNIEEEKTEEITEGYLLDAIMASSNVPGAFTPTLLGGMELLDGGVLEEVPIQLCRKMGANYVVASHIPSTNKSLSSGFNYINYISSLSIDLVTDLKLSDADEPYIFESQYSWYEFDKYEEIYNEAKTKLAQQKSGEINVAN
ncbi:putative esterase of the alpha-beta hydrolase superfamily [Marinitoga piezophila KA3]|uniref:Putative esterase of the alpha-beta hydrolase superfamily n=1 Tax=Marinitoga piezophila (strain DSM 14283 / JCM 11233 / KA3) TaxID=443254 RepID=H2J363_MARPK|nr:MULTISPECIES: patatin-like phospholipase family protein [Marinitoga]AEX84581.1 putative esterase of the alpha-beta hydrolase superfamily [Marinitoga piezophila KA3]NUU96812.1 hypothetical protein [Marinitoga sp. 1138]